MKVMLEISNRDFKEAMVKKKKCFTYEHTQNK